MRSELRPILDLAQTLAPNDLAVLLGELRTIEIIAQGRLNTPATAAKSEEWLDVKECAARLRKSKDYVYRNARKWPFARRIGRSMLFSSSGLDAFLRRAR